MNIQQIAKEIAVSLFTNGSAEKADRLVLTKDGKGCIRDLGGLCERAVVDRVAEIIKKYTNP